MNEPAFLTPPEPVALRDIAAWVGGRIARGGEIMITGIAPLDLAGPGDLAFIENTRYIDQLGETKASACLCSPKFADRVPTNVVAVVVDRPYVAFAEVTRRFYPRAMRPEGFFDDTRGISDRAVVHESARLEDDVTVEPGAVIGAGAEVGVGSVICANAVIGAGVRIGRGCSVGANAVLQFALIGNDVIIHPGVKIGQDGFGFAMGAGGHKKVPQIGRVIVQDNVEIGANSTIDRGTNRDTIVGEGTKIDNQVQIAHNVVIGRHCVIVAMAGISGSTVLEDYAVLAGKAGLAGHLRIGMGAQIAGGSNVANDVPAGERWFGTPAKPIREYMREARALRELAEERRPGKKERE
ncbi:UDP-3-O-[3-hydroxymyristoyl] glucosamine N-acyltransferase [Rhodobium orientis]|uniref:UDP-3-O-acylglucosamine N-acyltransferase n=1 Tax=Rhodobium orientis TaxID=34017 RepID=A0A327JUQ5_9HYPH|nr:UDP-3-O-(3-hydroxymyristoyl)glucosamine N-acyltransferase [Rhodobium orientis]MBB4302448.1 UDP-3-O-[3-hydroxymyristoyl] glucosamine N-acyltransferase [Rhodobium orientis]MBK5949297.1 UDP-3-O-(3-hydroxymyristoyl)glucosamine N-acyltransferase [Rhodobium orientis]RAI28652.1 UDP-3-O-(3-hydroxymyristoyl)glucosamine N-acyltransferase [Rhodobium orientis]